MASGTRAEPRGCRTTGSDSSGAPSRRLRQGPVDRHGQHASRGGRQTRQHRRQRRRADREQQHHGEAAADHRLAQNAEGTIAVDLGNSAQEVVLSRDPEQAARISRDDDAMDDLHKHLFTVLMDKEWKHGMAAAVDVTLLGRFYERFADHAVETGRRVVFQVTGETPDD